MTRQTMPSAPRRGKGRRRRPRQLGRPARARRGPPLPAAVAGRPPDRHLAAADPLLVGPRCSPPPPIRPACGSRDAWIALGCALGAVLMRGAGCTWNDLTDRDIDAARRPHPLAPAALRPGDAARRPPSGWWRRRSRAFAILLTFPPPAILPRRRLAGARRDLSLRQALHLVAAGLPRPRLQLGRAARLGGARRRPRPRRRCCSTPPASPGRCSTTRSTPTRTARTTR